MPAVRTLPPPPPRVTPRAFYEQYLPTLWRSLGDLRASSRGRLTIQMELSSPGGGAVQFLVATINDSDLIVSNAPTETPDIRLLVDSGSWTTAVRDIWPRCIDFLNEYPSRWTDRLSKWLDTNPWEQVAQFAAVHAGTIRVLHTDDAGDILSTLIVLGDGAGPDASISSQDRTLDLLLSGERTPVELWRMSLFEISGDTAYLVQWAGRFFTPGPG